MNSRIFLSSAIVLAASICAFGDGPVSLHSAPPKLGKTGKPVGQTLFQGHSFAFTENRGQFDAEVKFQARSGNSVLWFTRSGVVFDVVSPSDLGKGFAAPAPNQRSGDRKRALTQRLVFREMFEASQAEPEIEASGIRPGVYNYLIGNDPAKWRTGVKSFSQLLYRNVWPGIDVRFIGEGSDIEQEFVVSPGADVSSIQVRYAGVNGLEVPADGSLVVETQFGPLRESSPRIYQQRDGHRDSVYGKYLVSGLTYKFKLDSYDTHHPVVIDPTLSFSTYIGAGGIDAAAGIAVDPAGNTYIAGTTHSPSATPYPTTSGAFQPTPPNPSSAVVSKFDPFGNLVYSTYLGSTSGGDNARGIAANSRGEAYIAGVAYPGFPTTGNAFQQGCDASSFMSKLSSDGSVLLYSSCFGYEGYGAEYGVVGGNALALDAAGRAYLSGSTDDSGFPVTSSALQQSLTGQASAYLSVIDASLSGSASLVYSTHLGGEVADAATAIAVDSLGNAYITGNTTSDHFPTTPNAFETDDPQNVCYNAGLPENRCFTGFVAKINPNLAGGAGLIYSTYLGGSVGDANGYGEGDFPKAIAVDSAGSAYAGGYTYSTSFPTTPGADQSCSSTPLNLSVGFISKLSADGSRLVYSTYLPTGNATNGCDTTPVYGLALNAAGNAFVVGYSKGNGISVTEDALQPAFAGGNFDGFLAELSVSGTSVVYSSYVGGGNDDRAVAIALDQESDVHVAGNTSSTNFPVTPDAFQSSLAADPSCNRPGVSCQDIFVSKFHFAALPSCASDISNQLTITRGGFRYNHAMQSFVQTISLTNTGVPITGASLVLDSLSSGATLTGATGKTTCAAPLGSPLISIPGTLATGQSVSLTLTFSDPTQATIQYSTRVLAGGGQQ